MESLKSSKGLFDSMHMITSFDNWPLLLKEHNNGEESASHLVYQGHCNTVLNKMWEIHVYLYDNVSITTMNKCIETLIYNALVNKYKRYL